MLYFGHLWPVVIASHSPHTRKSAISHMGRQTCRRHIRVFCSPIFERVFKRALLVVYFRFLKYFKSALFGWCNDDHRCQLGVFLFRLSAFGLVDSLADFISHRPRRVERHRLEYNNIKQNDIYYCWLNLVSQRSRNRI